MKKKIYFWLIAIVLTLAASVYQRVTGPTYPFKLDVTIEGQDYTFHLPRSGGERNKEVLLPDVPPTVKAVLHWRCYPSSEGYQSVPFTVKGGVLQAALPQQPRAGKLAYYLTINGKDYRQEIPLLIRFKGDVEAKVLIPHIFFLFLAMLIACYTLLQVISGDKHYRKPLWIATLFVVIGGFIFGPIVQYEAFGAYWTGIPYGYDLTDNKTLIAGIFLLAASFTTRYRWNRYLTMLAVIVLFAIFTIPHSLYGSQLNRDTGQVQVGRSK